MTANWRKRGKGEDELKTVFCLSLGRAGTLELYFPFFFFFYHTVFTFFVPSTTPSLSHPCCLSLPPSLALWDNFKVKPFGQSASCKDLHHCFPFLSLLACVCNLSSVRARVSELNILSWPHTEQHTRTHSHTNSDQASSRVVFKNPLHSPWGTEALCTRCCCVCVSSASTNWQASHCSSCIFNVSDVLWYFCLARGSSARRYMEMQRLNSTVTV